MKFLVRKYFSLADSFMNLTQTLRILVNKNISIDKTCKIERGVKLDLHLGGSIQIGMNTEVKYGVYMSTHGGEIIIGQNCSINPYTVIYGHGSTVIGNNVLIAGHCMIIPANHNFKSAKIPIVKQGLTQKGICIEDDVWIGGNCMILDGVTLGRGSVIAAGSVVNKSTSPFTVYAGVPAKVIDKRDYYHD